MYSSARVLIVPAVEFVSIGVTFLKSLVSFCGPGYFILAFVFIGNVVVFGAVAAGIVLFCAFDYDLLYGGLNSFFRFNRSFYFFIVIVSNRVSDFFAAVFTFLGDFCRTFTLGAIIDGFDGIFDRLFDLFVLSNGSASLRNTKNGHGA